jgi:hypothetical protein
MINLSLQAVITADVSSSKTPIFNKDFIFFEFNFSPDETQEKRVASDVKKDGISTIEKNTTFTHTNLLYSRKLVHAKTI